MCASNYPLPLSCAGDSIMATVQLTAWRDVTPWSVVLDPADDRWTVLPSYPRGVFRLRQWLPPYAVVTLTPAPGDTVPVVVLDEREVVALLHRELGAVAIPDLITCRAEADAHAREMHDVPMAQIDRWHRSDDEWKRWHIGLHTGQAGAPYALMSVPHTHQ
jgi:hypothetical protein